MCIYIKYAMQMGINLKNLFHRIFESRLEFNSHKYSHTIN